MRIGAPFSFAATLFALSSVASSVAAPESARPVDAAGSTITVHVFKSGLLRTFGDNHEIRGALVEGWIDESGATPVELLVDATQLRVVDPDASAKDRAQVQARMLGPDVLDAARFPQIRFRSTNVQNVGADRWLVRGVFELHGHARDAIVHVIRENGRYRGQTKLRQTDFGITPVSVAGGTVKVKDEVMIDFDIATSDR